MKPGPYHDAVPMIERIETERIETERIEPSERRSEEVRKFYGQQCFACGAKRTEIDHIEPKSRGGEATFENLQPLCRKCNNAKADQLPRNIIMASDPWSDRN